MVKLNPRQIACILDPFWVLKRESASGDFIGSGGKYDSRTVYSLIEKRVFFSCQSSKNGYPLIVHLDSNSTIYKAVKLIGKKVEHKYKGSVIQPLEVTGVGFKKGKVFVMFTTGSNFFRPIEDLLPTNLI